MKKELSILLDRVKHYGDICFIDEFGSYEEDTSCLTNCLSDQDWEILKQAIIVHRKQTAVA